MLPNKSVPECTYILLLWCFIFTNEVFAQNNRQQSFRVQPQNVEVITGDDVTLRCEVNDQRGQAQWTQDGFAFGFNREIPGFDRFSVIGDEADGVHNLRIRNISILDDGEYQCQVTPMLPSQAIRASATVTVLIPPASIEMVGHVSGSIVTVRAGDLLSLECLAKNGKPASKIHWFRGSQRIQEAEQEDKEEASSTESDRKNLRSKISVNPTSHDNNVVYMCRTAHPALHNTAQYSASIRLNVHYEPGNPQITGYVEGEIVTAQMKKTLTCRSHGGNPLPEVIWYKNNHQINTEFRQQHGDTINEYQFTVTPSDNNAKYECHVQNLMTSHPKQAEITMKVNFPPATVNITSVEEVNVGDVITVSCVAKNSNPAADVSLIINNHPPSGVISEQIKTPDGGFTTTTKVTGYEIRPTNSDLTVNCFAANRPVGSTKSDTKIITVLRPPEPPVIIGYDEGTVLRAGERFQLTCRSFGGNPLPDLKWMKGSEELIFTTQKDGEASVSTLNVNLQMSDNGAEYKCEASNSASSVPLVNSTRLTVMYPPERVKVEIEPNTPRAGENATLTCITAPAFPKANVSWWRDGFQVEGGTYGPDKPGIYEGIVTSYQVNLTATSELNREIYTCKADNGIGATIHASIILDINFPPVIELPNTNLQIKEGENIYVQASARANPDSMSFIWKRGVEILTRDRILNISHVSKEMAGLYTLQASNSAGTSTQNLTVGVKYAPIITEVIGQWEVNPQSKISLECLFDGSPQPEVEWKRKDYDMSQTETVSYKEKSVLLITNVSKADSGHFECLVSNDAGHMSMPNVSLVVNQIPEVVKSPQFTKAAAELSGTAHLKCRVKASPKVQFTWYDKDHQPIHKDIHPRYSVEESRLVDDLYTYESVMLVKNVTLRDHGFFLCEARNTMGLITTHIHLEGTTRPDAPLDLKVLNVTHDSILITWEPGFDGGLNQTFRVRYRALHSNSYKYLDVYPTNSTKFWLNDLDLGVNYDLSLVALNAKGESPYSTGKVHATTLSESPGDGPRSPGTTRTPRIPGLVIVIITLVGAALLVLNVALVTCFIRRKARKRLTDSPPLTEMERAISRVLADKGTLPRVVTLAVSTVGGLLVVINVVLVGCVLQRRRNKAKDSPASSDKGSSKSTTIEMYAPSSYTGTVTGETLSSISEKSRESYTNEDSADDYDVDGARVTAASTYLIEQLEPPPQYASRPPSHILPPPPATHNDMNLDDPYDPNIRRNQYNAALDHVPGYGTIGHRIPSSLASEQYSPKGSDQYPVATSRYNTYLPQTTNHPYQSPMATHTHPHSAYNGSLRRSNQHKLHFPKDYIRNGSMNNVTLNPLSPTGSAVESCFTTGSPAPVSPTRSNPPSLSSFMSDVAPQTGSNIMPIEQRGHLV